MNHSISINHIVASNITVNATKLETELDGFRIVSVLSTLTVCNIDVDQVPIIECGVDNTLCSDFSMGYQRAQFALANDNIITRVSIREVKDVQSTCSIELKQ